MFSKIKDMDTLPTSSSKSESDPIQVQTSKECKTIEYIRDYSDSDRILEDLQSLRMYVVGDFSFFQNKYLYLTHFCF